MKILVGITNHGTGHGHYLDRLLEEYRRMPFQVDRVVFSNIPKQLGPEVEVVVGLPDSDPWSLGFAHRRVFVERAGDYDLFIYSEDDTLITADHLRAYLEVDALLAGDEVAGFLRTEHDDAGRLYCTTVHSRFHWLPDSYREVGRYRFARFTNDHAASYLLTRDRLQRAIESGGYALAPHQGRYDLLCTAATDPYTQCGMRKLICISHLERFLLPHLPNRYRGRVGLGLEELKLQVEALGDLARDNGYRGQLFPTATRLRGTARWDKRYYEPPRQDLLPLIPRGARRILSFGCGWGETESRLVREGRKVTALALDGVIAVSGRLRGVEVAGWQPEQGLERLSGRLFDCILLPEVLPHLPDPVGVLRELALLLDDGGVVVGSLPNLAGREARRVLQGEGLIQPSGPEDFARSPGSAGSFYRQAGLHWSDRGQLRRWLEEAGLQPLQVEYRRRAVGWIPAEATAAVQGSSRATAAGGLTVPGGAGGLTQAGESTRLGESGRPPGSGGRPVRRSLLRPGMERLLLVGPIGRLLAAQILFTARRRSRVLVPDSREIPIWAIRT